MRAFDDGNGAEPRPQTLNQNYAEDSDWNETSERGDQDRDCREARQPVAGPSAIIETTAGNYLQAISGQGAHWSSELYRLGQLEPRIGKTRSATPKSMACRSTTALSSTA